MTQQTLSLSALFLQLDLSQISFCLSRDGEGSREEEDKEAGSFKGSPSPYSTHISWLQNGFEEHQHCLSRIGIQIQIESLKETIKMSLDVTTRK